MFVYRIVKSLAHSDDISGTGAYRYGGRWNSKGTFMLYTSMNSSLAYLENLVHFDESNLPPDLYIITLSIPDDAKMIYHLPDAQYSGSWQVLDNPDNKIMGDKWMMDKKHLAVRVRSAINSSEYNYLLNPMFPRYYDLVKVHSTELLPVDSRLIR